MTCSGYLLDSGNIDHAIRIVYVQFRGNWLLVRGHADRVGPFLFGATWVGQLEHWHHCSRGAPCTRDAQYAPANPQRLKVERSLSNLFAK